MTADEYRKRAAQLASEAQAANYKALRDQLTAEAIICLKTADQLECDAEAQKARRQ